MISIGETDDTSIKEVKEQKQKLTLGLSRNAIERAKAAGINISAITEQLLLAITYEPKGNTEHDVVKAYESLFYTIRPLLIQYGTSIEVGGSEYYNDPEELTQPSGRVIICLEKSGLIAYDVPGDQPYQNTGWPRPVSVSDELARFYNPRKILENLVLDLTEAAETNKGKIKELELALRFVRALSEEDKGGKKE